ncbi:MAG: hypothetical protein ACPGYP_05790, partial [Solirubrobacterales bacterium]
FGIDGDVGMILNLLVVGLIAIWFALVFWTYADSRRRLTDPVLIGSATLAALIFPFAGALVYAIVRPPESLDDAYERELDVRAAELRVRLLESAVKGGPGSSAHAASLAGEMSGEPTGRRSSPPPSGSPQTRQEGQNRSEGQRRAEAQRRQESSSARAATPSGSKKPQSSKRPASSGSSEGAPGRPTQPARRAGGEGSQDPTRRPPASGTDGA